MGCHGALHGSPYVAYVHRVGDPEPRAERRDKAWVSVRIGRFLLERRPDTILYVIEKLGWDPGLAFLEREYRILATDAVRVYEAAA